MGHAEAMGAFVRWIAGRYDQIQAAFGDKVLELREKALSSRAHARTPDIVASLQAAFELFLQFGHECGVIGDVEYEALASRCWGALRIVALAQGKHHAATEPTARFLELLHASLASGRAHLQSRDGTMPERASGACGWRLGGGGTLPLGDCIGWVDGDDLYLEPSVAYRVIQTAAREMGDPFSIAEQTLRKRLHEKKLLASIDQRRGTLTVRRTLASSNRAVLHLRRSTLLPESPEDDTADGAEVEEATFVR